MSDRSLIFNAKGAQLGYIEADRAFDLTGRERCKYARAHTAATSVPPPRRFRAC